MGPVDSRTRPGWFRPDFFGWAALVVLLIPTFWVMAPVASVLCAVRVGWLLRADRDVPNPTSFALLLGLFLSVLWVWYFGSILSGSVP